MFKRIFLFLLTAALPGAAFSAPIVYMSSFDVNLSTAVDLQLTSGSTLSASDTQHINTFKGGHSSTDLYANIDGDPVGFFADANLTTSSNYISMMTGAEMNWDGGYDPTLPDALLAGSSANATARLSATFSVSEAVDFTGQVLNYSGNQSISYGTIALFDTTAGFTNILNIWDDPFNYFVRETVSLQPTHTYALYASSMNSTGDDEEIYTEMWFDDDAVITMRRPWRWPRLPRLADADPLSSPMLLAAQSSESILGTEAVATPNPPALLLFVIGLALLGAIKVDLKRARSGMAG